MAARNRYRGILQPRQVGLPRGEMPLILLYDIEDNRIRTRVSDLCQDYGLDRIQYSAFFGRLTRDKREELTLRLMKEIEEENVRVRIIPFTEECLESMWEYNWWRRDADEMAADAGRAVEKQAARDDRPSIRIVRVGKEDG